MINTLISTVKSRWPLTGQGRERKRQRYVHQFLEQRGQVTKKNRKNIIYVIVADEPTI